MFQSCIVLLCCVGKYNFNNNNFKNTMQCNAVFKYFPICKYKAAKEMSRKRAVKFYGPKTDKVNSIIWKLNSNTSCFLNSGIQSFSDYWVYHGWTGEREAEL